MEKSTKFCIGKEQKTVSIVRETNVSRIYIDICNK